MAHYGLSHKTILLKINKKIAILKKIYQLITFQIHIKIMLYFLFQNFLNLGLNKRLLIILLMERLATGCLMIQAYLHLQLKQGQNMKILKDFIQLKKPNQILLEVVMTLSSGQLKRFNFNLSNKKIIYFLTNFFSI